jgi:hypothetical protein
MLIPQKAIVPWFANLQAAHGRWNSFRGIQTTSTCGFRTIGDSLDDGIPVELK